MHVVNDVKFRPFWQLLPLKEQHSTTNWVSSIGNPQTTVSVVYTSKTATGTESSSLGYGVINQSEVANLCSFHIWTGTNRASSCASHRQQRMMMRTISRDNSITVCLYILRKSSSVQNVRSYHDGRSSGQLYGSDDQGSSRD